MGKKLICAVAGSGKTTTLLNSIVDDKRYLIVTYTNENYRSLESALVTKYGCVPEHVYLTTYFSFLYSFCYRPFFSYQLRDNCYTWNIPPQSLRSSKKAELRHYISKGGYLYSNRLAKLLIEFGALPKIVARIEKHFDCFYIDEIQDFAANDFNFLLALSASNVSQLFVGDFYQHTFDTSRDGATRKNLHKKGGESYLNEFRKMGFTVDIDTLSRSYRCGPTVCEFIRTRLGVPIESHRSHSAEVTVVQDTERALELFYDDEKIKLFFQDSGKYECYSNNWGKSKGLNKYLDVCVVLNEKTQKYFEDNKLSELPDSTRNKLYVACSRTRRDLYILDGRHLKDLEKT